MGALFSIPLLVVPSLSSVRLLYFALGRFPFPMAFHLLTLASSQNRLGGSY